MSLLQQSDKGAPSNFQSRLGKLPHQIRGNLSNQETFSLSGTAFEHCTCCSELILKEFQEKGFEFIKNACNSPKELEKISGLTDLKQITEEMQDFSVEEEEGDNDF